MKRMKNDVGPLTAGGGANRFSKWSYGLVTEPVIIAILDLKMLNEWTIFVNLPYGLM